ncbi:hypothetical protein DVH05_007370 [Phytophthora capsici]|nr:hypothetical protein DVH05_007370 [Phytophthora capsici]
MCSSAASTPSPNITLPGTSRIAYVKLKKGEVSETAVLSDCEKYNVVRAEVMPLVDALQLLPSHKFYAIFGDLRATITDFKEKWGLSGDVSINVEDPDDDAANEEAEVPPEVAQLPVAMSISGEQDLEVAQLSEEGCNRETLLPDLGPDSALDMDLHRPEDDLDACCLENPSQVSLPDLDFSEQSQEALQLPSEGPAPGPQSVAVKSESANAASTFDVLKLPVLSTTRAKSSTKGKWSIEERHSECPIKLKAFLKWMTHTEDLDTVGTTATAYPVCYDKSYML